MKKQEPINFDHLTWDYCAEGHGEIKYRGLKCPMCSMLLLSDKKDKEIECLKKSLEASGKLMINECENHQQSNLMLRGRGYVPVTDY